MLATDLQNHSYTLRQDYDDSGLHSVADDLWEASEKLNDNASKLEQIAIAADAAGNGELARGLREIAAEVGNAQPTIALEAAP